MAVEIARQPQFQRMNAAYIGEVGKRKPVGRIAVIELAHRGGIGGLVGGEPVDQTGEFRPRDAWKEGAIDGRPPGTAITGIGKASGRERGWMYGSISGGGRKIKKT